MKNIGYHFERNLIVVAGPFATGKTYTIGQINDFFFNHNLWYEKPVSDATFILDALDADHRYNDGVNHMHPDQARPQPHEHNPMLGKDLQFTVTGSYIPDYMYTRFFNHLSEGFPSDKLQVVEWSGGINTNPKEHPAHNADYSFSTQVNRLHSGLYNRRWMNRVLMVIHPRVVDGKQRLDLNERRRGRNPTQEEIQTGRSSWYIPESGMLLTGYDDFPLVKTKLARMGISGSIFSIENDGTGRFAQNLAEVLNRELSPLLKPNGKEGQTVLTRKERR